MSAGDDGTALEQPEESRSCGCARAPLSLHRTVVNGMPATHYCVQYSVHSTAWAMRRAWDIGAWSWWLGCEIQDASPIGPADGAQHCLDRPEALQMCPPPPFAHTSARRIPVPPAGWMDGRMLALVRDHGRCWEGRHQRDTTKRLSASLVAPRAEGLLDSCAVRESRPHGRGTGLPMAGLDEQPWDVQQQQKQKQKQQQQHQQQQTQTQTQTHCSIHTQD